MNVSVIVRVFQTLVESWQAHIGTKLLKKDFHKNPTGRSCGLFTHPDAFQHLVESQKEKVQLLRLRWTSSSCWCESSVSPYTPWNRVSVEQVSKQSGHVPQLVGFQSVNSLVLLWKYCLKTLHVLLFQQTEPLNKETQTQEHMLMNALRVQSLILNSRSCYGERISTDSGLDGKACSRQILSEYWIDHFKYLANRQPATRKWFDSIDAQLNYVIEFVLY